MSLRGFQQALSELVMSPGFRAAVQADPEAGLAGYELSARERRRLATVAEDPRTGTGTLIHRSFRLSMLSNTLPRTCRLLGADGMETTIHDYWAEHLPRNFLYAKEAARFGEFLRRRIRRGEPEADAPYLSEVLETELALLELGPLEAWQPPAQPLPEIAAAPLRLHPLCRLLAFRHDPLAVLTSLDEGAEAVELPIAEHYLLLVSGPPGRADLRSLGTAAGRALEDPAGAATTEPELVSDLVVEGFLVPAVQD